MTPPVTSLAPASEPNARLFLIQKDQRLRLAATEIMREMGEVRHDLMMWIAALDEYEEDVLRYRSASLSEPEDEMRQ